MLSFFPLDVLDGILDLIESVSEGFLTYSLMLKKGQDLLTRVNTIADLKLHKGIVP